MIKVCDRCGKEFEANESRIYQKYCSIECREKARIQKRRETYERKKEEKKKKVVDKLQQDAAGAREAGMTYGQYMAKKGMV